MDTALTTNAPGASLTFRGITRYPGETGYSVVLAIESTPFAASLPFSFEPHPLEVFLRELRRLNKTLHGSATLKPMWEPDFVRFEGNGRGHIIVAGELGYSEQHLRFGFETDQTCLTPLIRDVEGWPQLAAV
jgi:hypothetical protein